MSVEHAHDVVRLRGSTWPVVSGGLGRSSAWISVHAKGTGMSSRRFLMRCNVIVTSSRRVHPGPATREFGRRLRLGRMSATASATSSTKTGCSRVLPMPMSGSIGSSRASSAVCPTIRRPGRTWRAKPNRAPVECPSRLRGGVHPRCSPRSSASQWTLSRQRRSVKRTRAAFWGWMA